MTKVTLLGDSIRAIGYGYLVPKILGENYEVFQPAENCRFAKHTLRGICDWENDMNGSDIIHWNNGLWDTRRYLDGELFTDIDEYVKTMIRIAELLKQRGKVVIFATTTPVDPHHENQDNAIIAKFNAAVVPELEKRGVLINDLYAEVYPNLDKYIRDDKIHLNDVGSAAVAQKVADIIKQAEKSIKN